MAKEREPDSDMDDRRQDGHYALGFKGKYVLPVTDVQEERRNFPGYVTYPNMLPLSDEGGTTDTDEKTHETYGQDSGYTRIYGGTSKASYTGKDLREIRKGR